MKKRSKVSRNRSQRPKKSKAKLQRDDPPSPTLAVEREIKAAVDAFVKSVTLSRWEEVAEKIASFEEDDAKRIYSHLLVQLRSTPPAQGPQPQGAVQKNIISPEDLAGLCRAAPVALDDNHLQSLSQLLLISIEQGYTFGPLTESLREGLSRGDEVRIGGENPETRRLAAKLFLGASRPKLASEFLPSLEDAKSQADADQLNLLATHALQVYQQEQKQEQLERVWRINQAILALPGLESDVRDQSLQRAVDLSTRVKKELGQAWMEKSFTDAPEQGMQVLTSLGTSAAENMMRMPQNNSMRLKTLRLQSTAVEALLRSAPELADKWQATLTLLAKSWLNEARLAKKMSRADSGGAIMQIDMYGNYYWIDRNTWMQRNSGRANQLRPIAIGDLLEVRPSDHWLKVIESELLTQFSVAFAQLHFRANEEDKAFPYIEKIAPEHPGKARELVHEFLRIWTKNHDPNTDRKQRNPYIFFYGFDTKASSIPLTRSKQERNLVELRGWVERIRKLPIEDVDETLLANAFTNSHSSAEVFRIEAIESVFGRIDTLKPETVADLCQKMRQELAGRWRDLRNQEAKENKTSRTGHAAGSAAWVFGGIGIGAGSVAGGAPRLAFATCPRQPVI